MVKFSVIIPTRERHETLPFAIRTVLLQTFEDFEIIVCDNCSSIETKKAVAQFNSPKIKYVRSDIPLSMHENWELAVNSSSGEYLILFGDDDGLLPNSLKVLNELLMQSTFKVIAWDRIHYHWPNLLPQQLSNQIQIPIADGSFLINGAWIIKEIVEGRKPYTFLPMLYNGVIKRNLIEELKNKTGSIFRSISPDIYSGFAFAQLSGEYLYLNTPMSINGGSAKSNGHSFFNKANDSVVNDFKELNNKSGVSFHWRVPYIKSIHAVVADSYYHLNDCLLKNTKELNREMVFRKIVRGIKATSLQEWNRNLEKIKDVLVSEPKIYNKLKDEGLLTPPVKFDIGEVQSFKKGIERGTLTIDAAQFGICNVLDASVFCEKLLSFENKNMESYQPVQNLRHSLKSIWVSRFKRIIR